MIVWKYSCHQCQSHFEMPVPLSPKDEKERKCPRCGSADIHRVTTEDSEPRFRVG